MDGCRLCPGIACWGRFRGRPGRCLNNWLNMWSRCFSSCWWQLGWFRWEWTWPFTRAFPFALACLNFQWTWSPFRCYSWFCRFVCYCRSCVLWRSWSVMVWEHRFRFLFRGSSCLGVKGVINPRYICAGCCPECLWCRDWRRFAFRLRWRPLLWRCLRDVAFRPLRSWVFRTLGSFL